MNKRGILALFMAVMMLIISVPASAAIIAVPSDSYFALPEDGAAVPESAFMRSLLAAVPNSEIDFQFVDNAEAFGDVFQNINGDIAGATLSAHVTYVGTDEADLNDETVLKEWDMIDVPICGLVLSGAKNSARLGFSLADLAAHTNGAITVGTNENGKEVAVGLTAKTEEKRASTYVLSNIVLKAGTAKFYNPKTIDTGSFPEGTVFLSKQKFSKGSNGQELSDWGGYSNFYGGSGHNTTFIAKQTGTYEVWELTSTHSGQVSRYASLTVNDTTATVSDSTNRGNLSMMWAKTNASIPLNAGESVTVTVNCGDVARFAGAAFVPANAQNKPTENFVTTSSTGISNGDLKTLHEITAEITYGPDVNVTVDGAAVKTAAGSAVKAGVISTGFVIDAAGNAVSNATVSDALVSAGKLPVSAGRVLAYLNGNLVVNPEMTYVSDGDEITVKIATDGFSPFSPTHNDFALNGIYEGGDSRVRFMFKQSFTESNIGADYATAARLNGAHVNGVAMPRMAGTTMKMDTMNGYVLFRNQAAAANGVNYAYNGNPYVEMYTEGNVTAKADKDSALLKSADGSIIGLQPNIIHGDLYSYVWDKLYITDKYTTGKTVVIDNGTHKLVTVDGADDLLIIVKNADGTIASAIHQTVTFNAPYALTLQDGQTAYIWNYTNYVGTNMKPLCEVVK